MPPEQASGDGTLAAPSLDIYALGATLYHIITGQMPYHGEAGNPLHSLGMACRGARLSSGISRWPLRRSA